MTIIMIFMVVLPFYIYIYIYHNEDEQTDRASVSRDSGINKSTSNMESAPFITLTNIQFRLELGSVY